MAAKKKDVLQEQVAELYENHRELGENDYSETFYVHGRKSSWEATSELQLKTRILQSIEALNQEVLKTMMGEVPQRVRKAARAGTLQFVH